MKNARLCFITGRFLFGRRYSKTFLHNPSYIAFIVFPSPLYSETAAYLFIIHSREEENYGYFNEMCIRDRLDIDNIDIGVPVLSMHAPFEVTSKIDIYSLYRAFVAFIG